MYIIGINYIRLKNLRCKFLVFNSNMVEAVIGAGAGIVSEIILIGIFLALGIVAGIVYFKTDSDCSDSRKNNLGVSLISFSGALLFFLVLVINIIVLVFLL